MTLDQLRDNVIRGALSGYLRLTLRLVLGLITFRLLFQYLAVEEFGFWSLLWAIFGYGILLDFGFGAAAQKRVAELSVRADWPGLGRVLSSILAFYCLAAAVVSILGILGSGQLVDLLRVSPNHRDSFRLTLQVFFVGLAFAFPLGLFPDVLQGQQRLATANNIMMISMVANFAAVLACVYWNLGLTPLVVLALLAVLVPYLLAATLAMRQLPHVRLRPGLVSLAVLRDTVRFGVYAYLNTASTVLRQKADQPILGGLLGVASVTLYQPGSRVGEMFGLVTRQIADVLSPTAAHLHARGDTDALHRMLLDGLRVSVLVATPLYLFTAAYMEALLRLLTGLASPTPEMVWVGQTVLAWYYSLTLTHWVFKRMYMMAGQERRMMWQGVIEALLNLVLAVVLTATSRSILGVAVGALIPTLGLGWTVLWGWAAREVGLSRLALFSRVVLPAWKACLPMLAALLFLKLQPWWISARTLPLLLLETALTALLGALGLWFLGLAPDDRSRVLRRLLDRTPNPATRP